MSTMSSVRKALARKNLFGKVLPPLGLAVLLASAGCLEGADEEDPARSEGALSVGDIGDALKGLAGDAKNWVKNTLLPTSVTWGDSSPTAQLWSYKIEENNTSPVRFPSKGTTEGVDGIYRDTWGCQRAFKLPNGCHAEVKGGVIRYVCLHGAASFVDTNASNVGWPTGAVCASPK